MTPALKAMVEAMVEEVSRQVYTDYTTKDPSPEPFLNELVVDGRLDLEKVARAALAAIRPADQAVLEAMRQTVPADGHEWEYVDEDAPGHWAAMIDAILGESQ